MIRLSFPSSRAGHRAALTLGCLLALTASASARQTFDTGVTAPTTLAELPRPSAAKFPPLGYFGEDIETLPALSGEFDRDHWVLEGDPMPFATYGSGGGPPARPTVALRGRGPAIEAALQGAFGRGFQIEEWLPTGERRVSFYGEVYLIVDRRALDSGAVKAELLVDAGFAGAAAVAGWKGGASEPFALPAGIVMPVPLARITQPALDPALATFVAVDAVGGGYQVQAGGDASWVGILQTQL